MTYLAGSVGSLITDRNTWHSRADQAWGTSRVWNSGSSFESDSLTWHGRADQAWGGARVWSSGESFESAAWTGNAYGSGQLWRDAAHNDPNVWTNRYNTGYTDGANSKTTTSASATPAASSQKTNGQNTGTLATLVAPRTGLAHVSAFTRVNRHNTNAGDFSVQMQILRNGGVIATGPVANCGNVDTHEGISADATVNCNSGDSFTIQCQVNSTAGSNSADFDGTGSMTLSVGSV
jgi:hypothetical protein